MESFEQGYDGAQRRNLPASFLKAWWPYESFPPLVFESDTADLFGNILSVFGNGFRGVLLNEFKDFIHTQNVAYVNALEVFEERASEEHSNGATVDDLFPVIVRNMKGDGSRRVRYDALIVAYKWLHGWKNIKAMREGGEVPSIFLTDDCIFLYSVVVRGKIGDWLLENEDLWLF